MPNVAQKSGFAGTQRCPAKCCATGYATQLRLKFLILLIPGFHVRHSTEVRLERGHVSTQLAAPSRLYSGFVGRFGIFLSTMQRISLVSIGSPAWSGSTRKLEPHHYPWRQRFTCRTLGSRAISRSGRFVLGCIHDACALRALSPPH